MSIASDLRGEKDARFVIFNSDGIGDRTPTEADLCRFAYDSWDILYPHGIGIRFTDSNDNDVAIHVSPREVQEYLRATCPPKGF